MSVSKRLRYEVMRRDNFTCRYCGADDVRLTVDHVTPIALGGTDEPGNLVTACADCNAGKSSSVPDAPIVEAVTDDALRWANAMKEAAELQGADRRELQLYRDVFLEKWGSWNYGADKMPLPLPVKWPDSLEQFFRAGLEIDAVRDLVDVAGRSTATAQNTFKYFCGCCWRVIREQQDIARSLIETEGPQR